MEQITNILRGGYAYLLIFQILVVSSLFVMLMVMVVRRIRMEAEGVGEVAIPTVGGVPQAEFDALKAELAALNDDRNLLEKLKAENAALLEKIKFLESKLLEYEILQEEIGSLSNLKIENEKLKKELLALQKDMGKTGAQIEQMVQENSQALAAAQASEPKTMKADAVESSPSGPTEGPNLDNLLAEIDALSGTPVTKEAPKS